MSAIDVIETVRKMRAQETGYKEPHICERFDDFGKDGKPCRLGIMGGTFETIFPIRIGDKHPRNGSQVFYSVARSL